MFLLDRVKKIICKHLLMTNALFSLMRDFHKWCIISALAGSTRNEFVGRFCVVLYLFSLNSRVPQYCEISVRQENGILTDSSVGKVDFLGVWVV